jgi:DNA-binding transcriptional regulator LsrR (DeoR family)
MHESALTSVTTPPSEVLVAVARMYYERAMKQEQIATALGVSRSQVSRYLSAAHDRGIVQIRVISPAQTDADLEIALCARFARLTTAVVVPSLFETGPIVLSQVAAAGADLLTSMVRPGDTICVGAGRTLNQLVTSLPSSRRDHVTVVQAMGNAGHEGHDIDYNAIAIATAAAFGGRTYHVNSPAILGLGYDAERLENSNQSIAEALGRARRADLFVVGIGSLETDTLYLTTGLLSEQDLSDVAALDPAGDICGRFYDIKGRELPTPFGPRIVGITLSDLKHSRRVLAVASGVEKARSIAGALAGGYVTHLVTDEAVAKAVLESAPPKRPRSTTPPSRRAKESRP